MSVTSINRTSIATAIAFLTVLFIWSTTPLAIQWSSVGAPMTSVSLRMLIGMFCCSIFLLATTRRLPIDRSTVPIYLLGGISIYGAMSLFYAAAQEIPSGWIAVLFGLSPIATGVFSSFVEPETRLTPRKLLGLTLGLGGLYLVFSTGLNWQQASIKGVVYTLIATILSSASSVVTRQLVKDKTLSGMQITTGSLVVALPCFLITALILEPGLNIDFSSQAWLAIIYLGMIGTGVGFTLYYFLLKRVSASRLSLITLITPISALSLGSWLNQEPLIAEIWLGAALVCSGLMLYEFKPRLGLRRI